SLLLDGGILAVAAFLAVFGLTWKNAYRVFRRTPHRLDRSLAAAILAGTSSGLVSLCFGSHHIYPSFSGYMWLMAGLSDILAGWDSQAPLAGFDPGGARRLNPHDQDGRDDHEQAQVTKDDPKPIPACVQDEST
ncbi:MAG: hypothetical protein HQK57_16715, partial [Deltaproteobacteria bacterium]|nr:hypothetical protein [Deltaproteobacteria bacterium]